MVRKYHLDSPSRYAGGAVTLSAFLLVKAIRPCLINFVFTSYGFTMIFLPSIEKLIPLNSSIFKTADAFEFLEIRP